MGDNLPESEQIKPDRECSLRVFLVSNGKMGHTTGGCVIGMLLVGTDKRADEGTLRSKKFKTRLLEGSDFFIDMWVAVILRSKHSIVGLGSRGRESSFKSFGTKKSEDNPSSSLVENENCMPRSP
jgi:hypothetical protein